jgi:hypothetical protein
LVGELESRLSFVGAFPRPIPRGIPLSGSVSLGAAEIRIPAPGRRAGSLLALSLPLDSHPFQPELIHIKVATKTITGELDQVQELHLRSLAETDPPLVLAVPALILKDYP